MASTPSFQTFKDPNSILDYEINWQGGNKPFLGTDETISTSTWTPDSGITVDSNSKTSTTTIVWVSGGTAGTAYNIINHIVTNQGRADDATLHITVRNK